MKVKMYEYNVEDLQMYKYPFSKNKFRVKKMIHAFAIEKIRFDDYIEKKIKNETTR
jgi:hypothetical protein